MADWDSSNPADNAVVSLFPANERAARAALVTNFGIDHKNTVGSADIGKHLQVTLLDRGSDPAAVAGQGNTYSKVVSGQSELFWRSSTGAAFQLTSGTSIMLPATVALLAASNIFTGLTQTLQYAAGDGNHATIALTETGIYTGLLAGYSNSTTVAPYSGGLTAAHLVLGSAASAGISLVTANVARLNISAAGAITLNGVNVTDYARLSQANVFDKAGGNDQTISSSSANRAGVVFKTNGTTRAFIASAGVNDDLITGSLAGDLILRSQAGSMIITLDAGATINHKFGTTAATTTFNGIAVSDFARLSVGNTFVASNTRNSAVGSLFDRWQLSGVDKAYVGVGGGGAISGLTSSDFGFTSAGGGSVFLGTAGTARFTIDNSGNFNFLAGTVTTNNASASEVGYKGIPIGPLDQSGSYSAWALIHACTQVRYTGTGGHTFTIPANGSVAYPIGDFLVVTNLGSAALTIAITTDTLQLAGTATTGSRTLAVGGQATLFKADTTKWFISGPGVS